MSKEPDLSKVVISDKDRAIIQKAYYDDGMCFGRDGLFEYLKKSMEKPPSRRVVASWLSRQKLQQEFKGTRNGGTTDFFRPTVPFQSLSIDLIDFNNKPAQSNRKYILVVVDNFSRKMYCETLTSKEPVKSSPKMDKILQRIKSEHGKVPKFIISDDGSEWKGVFDSMLKEKYPGLERKRTLGGQPDQNGLCERANGKLKMLLAKNKMIHGGDWYDNLPRSLNAYNNQYNRMTKFDPSQALDLKTDEEQQELRDNVFKQHEEQLQRARQPEQLFKVGDKVRVKLNKGTLGKASTPSWSSTIYTIGKVVRRSKTDAPTVATKYKVKELAQDQNYSRKDLQIVEGTPEPIPVKPKKTVERERLLTTEGTFTTIEKQNEVREERQSRRARNQPSTFTFEQEGASDKQRKAAREEFEVEKIVSRKKEGNKWMYEVKWKGYDSKANTFQTSKDLDNSPELLKEFMETVAKKKPTQKLAASTPPRRQRTVDVSNKKESGRNLGF